MPDPNLKHAGGELAQQQSRMKTYYWVIHKSFHTIAVGDTTEVEDRRVTLHLGQKVDYLLYESALAHASYVVHQLETSSSAFS